MVRISYPEPDFRIEQREGRECIFDPLRRQWVRLTPEEWVRQNIVQYLLKTRQYPAALVAVEREIRVGELKKRFDIVVYQGSVPWMVIECKEMNVPLTEQTLRQALNYNITLQTRYLVITNGNEVFVFRLEKGNAEMMDEFPEWEK